jgi:Tol biopolymer transport system component
MRLDMKTKTRVVVTAAVTCAFSWAPAAARAQNVPQSLLLTWVDRTGNVMETVGPAGGWRGPDLSPDGNRLVVHRHDFTEEANQITGGDVFLFTSGPGPGTRVTGDGAGKVENGMPIWSPDGTRIAYGSMRNGKGGIYVTRVDGSGSEELLIESETSKMPMSWSPDGRFIVYWTPGNIQWILPLTGERKPVQLSKGPTSHAQISPDGRWIAYNDTSTRSEIYIRPFSGSGKAIRVSKDGGVFARWRGDGKELFFLTQASNGKLMAADIAVNGTEVQAGTPAALFDSGYVNLGHPGGNYHVFAVSSDGRRFLIPRPESRISPDAQNGRTLTLFDRQGNTVGTVGERGQYNQLALSPDRMHVALVKNDVTRGTSDVWVLDLASGNGKQVTSSNRDEPPSNPVWSPDGRQLAYVVSRMGREAIYRKPANGEGAEEVVYEIAGAGTVLSEWTADGRYLTYYSPQLGGYIQFALPLSGDRKPIEIARSEFPMLHARLSPDARFVAFRSNESGKDQIWVRRFNPSGPSIEKWQVSRDGGTGPVYWAADGRELYYLSLNREMMVVGVRAESGFQFGEPRVLFKIPEAFPAGNGIGGAVSMSRDGERFLFAVPPAPGPRPALPQITILDREGKSVKTVTEPGRYSNASLSPDGSRVLVRKAPETVGDTELWSFDVATGKGTLIASGQINRTLWAPDGRQIFYVTQRPGGFQVVMRKSSDGSGSEEMIYRYTPGAPVNITDISSDGRFLLFDSGGVILTVPLTGGDAATRQATEILREEYFAGDARFSPDGRYLAYLSNETDRGELYVREFDLSSGTPRGETKWQLTTDGADSILGWRADGRELYYSKGDLNGGLTMVTDISPGPTFEAGEPRFLFRSRFTPAAGMIGRDVQQFVVVLPR